MDGAGINWQLLDFGRRLHSFAEEETVMKGKAEFNAAAAHQTYRMLDNFISGCLQQEAALTDAAVEVATATLSLSQNGTLLSRG